MTRLRQRMIEDLEIRNYSPETIKGYVFYLAQFAKHFGKFPDLLGVEEIRQYQIHICRQRKIAHSTMVQVVCALRFFYKVTLGDHQLIEHIPYPKQEKKLPVVLNKGEVFRLVSSTRNLKHRTVLMTLYATGMRVSELTHVCVEDIDSQRMLIRVRRSKARKDRYIPLSPTLLAALRRYWKKYRPKGALFLSQRTRSALSNAAVFKICAEAQKQAHVSERVTPHTFRPPWRRIFWKRARA